MLETPEPQAPLELADIKVSLKPIDLFDRVAFCTVANKTSALSDIVPIAVTQQDTLAILPCLQKSRTKHYPLIPRLLAMDLPLEIAKAGMASYGWKNARKS